MVHKAHAKPVFDHRVECATCGFFSMLTTRSLATRWSNLHRDLNDYLPHSPLVVRVRGRGVV